MRLLCLCMLLCCFGGFANPGWQANVPAPIYNKLSTLLSRDASEAQDGVYPIRVAVYVDDAFLFRYSRGWTIINGKPVENGAQFVLHRIKTALAHANDLFAKQNFPARLHLHTISPWRTPHASSDPHKEFNTFSLCLWAREHNHPLCNTVKETMGDAGYQHAVEQMKGADIFLYWRDRKSTDRVSGTAYPGVGAVLLDDYHQHLPMQTSIVLNRRVPHADPGLHVLMHELGHVFGVLGHDSEACADTPSLMLPSVGAEPVWHYTPDSIEPQCQKAMQERKQQMLYTVSRLSHLRDRWLPVSSMPPEWRVAVLPSDDGTHKIVLTGSAIARTENVNALWSSWQAIDESAWEGRDYWFGFQTAQVSEHSQLTLQLTPAGGAEDVRRLLLTPVSATGYSRSFYPDIAVMLMPDGQVFASLKGEPIWLSEK